MRILNLFLLGCLIALSFLIYEVKYETGAMEEEVASLKTGIRRERDAIAILRAEWSHLNRPERIERLARKHLGLEPVHARQLVTLEQLAEMRKPVTDQGPGQVMGKIPPALRHPVKAVR